MTSTVIKPKPSIIYSISMLMPFAFIIYMIFSIKTFPLMFMLLPLIVFALVAFFQWNYYFGIEFSEAGIQRKSLMSKEFIPWEDVLDFSFNSLITTTSSCFRINLMGYENGNQIKKLITSKIMETVSGA